jgi:hypothetical protein
VHRFSGFHATSRRRLLVVGLAWWSAVSLWAAPAPVQADEAAPVQAGVCRFIAGTTSNDLKATFSPGLTSVAGDGSCTDAGGGSTISLTLGGGSGLTCTAGVQVMHGSASWSSGSPATVSNLTVVAAGTLSTLQLVIVGSGFQAVAELTWVNKNAIMACLDSGHVSVELTGVMVYVAT